MVDSRLKNVSNSRIIQPLKYARPNDDLFIPKIFCDFLPFRNFYSV